MDASSLHAMLLRRADAFILEIGRKPTVADIAADSTWYEMFTKLQELERAAATKPAPGGCSYYIKKRRRFCSNFVTLTASNRGLCTQHDRLLDPTEALMVEEEEDEEDEERPTRDGVLSADETQSALRIRKKTNLNRRMKKMTNPKALQFLTPTPAPDWESIFDDPCLPSFLDIGSAKGKFLRDLSTSKSFQNGFGRMNFIGVEIFESLVSECNQSFVKASRRNLHYIASNINVSCASLAFPNLTCLSIQFPDPWREPKKRNRRVVNTDLAQWAAGVESLREVFLVSDVLELAREMRDNFLATGSFTLHAMHRHATGCEGAPQTGTDNWLQTRPYGVPTERDLVCEIHWRPVYRVYLERC